MPALASLVQSWEARNPAGPTLWYPVAWDWRRDYWEQCEAVYNMTLLAKARTGCNPILVGYSLGGLLTYTAFTRYREALADNVHGVLYTAAPLQPFSVVEKGVCNLVLLPFCALKQGTFHAVAVGCVMRGEFSAAHARSAMRCCFTPSPRCGNRQWLCCHQTCVFEELQLFTGFQSMNVNGSWVCPSGQSCYLCKLHTV
jgi:hypothetical protein